MEISHTLWFTKSLLFTSGIVLEQLFIESYFVLKLNQQYLQFFPRTQWHTPNRFKLSCFRVTPVALNQCMHNISVLNLHNLFLVISVKPCCCLYLVFYSSLLRDPDVLQLLHYLVVVSCVLNLFQDQSQFDL